MPAAPPMLTFRQALMLMADRKEKDKGPGMDWRRAREWAIERQAARDRDPWGVGGGDGHGANNGRAAGNGRA